MQCGITAIMKMRKIRIIPRLDIKGPNLIKGIHLEGLRVVGDPVHYTEKYYKEGADELLYMDSVASLYERNSILEVINSIASKTFIPLTVGGGIRSVMDAKEALKVGADKIAINTAAIKNPSLVSELASTFGKQFVVASIEAKKIAHGKWEALLDNGREKTALDVIAWAKTLQSAGAGEILITSVDQEGTLRGFDIELLKNISDAVDIPIIASGGMGKIEDIFSLIQNTKVDAVAIAHVLHYGKDSLHNIKEQLHHAGVQVRL
jgi:cyclase